MKIGIHKIWLQAIPAIVIAGQAWAEAVVPHGEEAAHELVAHASKAHHDSGGGGLPQLDPTWYPSQIFWLTLIFVSLYVIFSRKILPALSKTLENRRTHIQGDLDMAEDNRKKAETVHKAYEEILEEARVKASDLFVGAEKNIKNQTSQKLESVRHKATQQTQDMEFRIEKAMKAAMEDMNTIAAEIASKAAEKIVGISTDLDQAKTVVQNISKKAA